MGKAERTKELGTFFSRAKSGVDHAEIDTKILAACLSFLAIWHLACCCDVYDCYCCFAMLVHKNVAVNNTVVNHKWKRPNIKKNIKQQQISKTKPTKRTRVASGMEWLAKVSFIKKFVTRVCHCSFAFGQHFCNEWQFFTCLQ